MEALEVPQGDDKIIVSIHAYLPYSFALDTAGTDQYTSIDSSITTLFTDINEVFLSKGIPVIIGEFGSVNSLMSPYKVTGQTHYIFYYILLCYFFAILLIINTLSFVYIDCFSYLYKIY